MAGLNSQERRELLAAAVSLHRLDELRGDLDVVSAGWYDERLSSLLTGRRDGKVVYSTMLAFQRER